MGVWEIICLIMLSTGTLNEKDPKEGEANKQKNKIWMRDCFFIWIGGYACVIGLCLL